MTDIATIQSNSILNINTPERLGDLTIRFQTLPEDIALISSNSEQKSEHVLPLFADRLAQEKQSIRENSALVNLFEERNKNELCVYGLGVKLFYIYFKLHISPQMSEASTGQVYIKVNGYNIKVVDFETSLSDSTIVVFDYFSVLDIFVDNIISCFVVTSNGLLGISKISDISVNII